jgi:Zn-dependent peptidase ImmA (M78 family)
MHSHEWKRLPDNIKQIIERYQGEQPMRVGALAQELGVVVKISSLSVGISGEIRPFGERGADFIIRVNRHEHKNRRRFTLAHELSHFLLHPEKIGEGIADNVLYRSRLSNQTEAAANRLAADILMPWNVIQEKLAEYSDFDVEDRIEKIATDLGVSTIALNIRLGIKGKAIAG